MADSLSRRSLLTGLAAIAAAPVLPALSHGEYAGEGMIGVLRMHRLGHPMCRCSLLPHQQAMLDWLERLPSVRSLWHEEMMGTVSARRLQRVSPAR